MFEEVAAILRKIKNTLHEDTDIVWTGYNTVTELRRQMERYIIRAHKGDKTVLPELDLAFAPTGLFQALALANSWGEDYNKLSKRFDMAYEKIKGDYR